MSVIVVYDPYRELLDGTIYENAFDREAIKRRGVCFLPFEEDAQYTRVGWGVGRIPMPGLPPVCPMPVYLGQNPGEFPWLHWVAVLYPTGTKPHGSIQIVSDSSRARTGSIGISAERNAPRIEELPMTGNSIVLQGTARCGGTGVASVAFAGNAVNVAIGITAVSFTRTPAAL